MGFKGLAKQVINWSALSIEEKKKCVGWFQLN